MLGISIAMSYTALEYFAPQLFNVLESLSSISISLHRFFFFGGGGGRYFYFLSVVTALTENSGFKALFHLTYTYIKGHICRKDE